MTLTNGVKEKEKKKKKKKKKKHRPDVIEQRPADCTQ
jgi:hypothetical protein